MANQSINSTPVKPVYSAFNQYSQVEPTLEQQQEDLTNDMNGHFVGPCEPTEFLSLFMPQADEPVPDAQFKAPRKNGSERGMYKSFGHVIHECGLSPKFEFFISADERSIGNTNVRPDAGMKEGNVRPSGGPSRRVMLRRAATRKSPIIEQNLEGTTGFDFHNDGLMVEFKASACDPFYTVYEMKKMVHPTLERATTKARETRGQLAKYATESFAHQQRSHLFQLVVFGKYARFIRWDRAGAIVSGRFDYVKRSDILAGFFWRYNHMTDAQRGLDMSVSVPSHDEVAMFTLEIGSFIARLKHDYPHMDVSQLQETTKGTYPVRKVRVEDDYGKEAMDLIVQRPFHHLHTPIGRATRTYLAVNLKTKKVYVLKDTWRVVHQYLKSEAEVLSFLEEKGVPNIPKILCGGDVKVDDVVQKTITQDWAKNNDLRAPCEDLRTHHHHRLIQEFAYTVNAVRNSKQFISAVTDCLETIMKAFECGILHRDVSLGNIMITKEGKGILNDWDHAGEISPPNGYQSQNFRTGTWQFMSCALLSDLRKKHVIQDDLESTFWATLFKGLHHFEHTGTFNMSAFEYKNIARVEDKVQVLGGGLKQVELGTMTVKFASFPLQELIDNLVMDIDWYYHLLNDRTRILRKGGKIRPNDETRFTEVESNLASPSFWWKLFKQARDSDGWLDNDVIPDKYPKTTIAAQTHEFAAAIISTFQGVSTSEIPFHEAGTPLGPQNAKVVSKAAAVDTEMIDSDAEEDTLVESEEHNDANLDVELEAGDAGGEDFPDHDVEAAWAHTEDTKDELEPVRASSPLSSVPPSSPIVSGTGMSFASSSAGTKRSVSDIFTSYEELEDSSPRPKKSKPMSKADRAAASAVPDSPLKGKKRRTAAKSGDRL